MVARSYETIEIYGPGHDPPPFLPLLSTAWNAWAADDKKIWIGPDTETRDSALASSIFEQRFLANRRSAGFHLVSGTRRVIVGFAVAERGVAFAPTAESFSSVRISIGWLRDTALAEKFLTAVSELLGAWFGWYTPEPSSCLLDLRLSGSQETLLQRAGKRYESLRRAKLPLLRAYSFMDWPDPGIPFRIGWLNFWSPRTAAALEWEAARENAATFRGGVNSGWILRLTEDPLDLRLPGHVEAVRAGYARFGKIGTRIG